MADEDEQGWRNVNTRNRSGRGINNFRPDIATVRNANFDNNSLGTTYFFTKFPERFGAKTIFNALHNYGEIVEVIIPVKRDKGGRRFGLARFDQVLDPLLNVN
jgi:hypothetical protein